VYCSKHGEISSLKVFRGTCQNPVEDISSTEPFTGRLDEPEPEAEPIPFTGTLDESEPKFKSEPLVDCNFKGILVILNSPDRSGDPAVAGTLK